MCMTSTKKILFLLFGCILLVFAIICTSKKSAESTESIGVTTEIENEVFDESTNIEDESINIKTESKDVEDENEVKVEPLFYLSDYERWVAECVVMGESGGESYDGQVLVAQCLLNGCIKEGLQPSEVRTKYQYSGWNENPTDNVKNAVKAVFDDGYKITDEFILYFYAPRYSKGKWHETQKFVIEEGNHRFFARWN